jgi:outer membrane protein assembly factor BamB
MIRLAGTALAICSLVGASAAKIATAQSISVPLISQEQAAQYGLQRAWVTQVPLDRARSKITHINLQSGLLLVVTSEGMLYVINPETGQINWSFQVGQPKMLALSAGANDTHVAVANTTRLFVLDRNTGNVVMDREVTGTPQQGPVLIAKKVLLPLVRGRLEAYPLPLDDNTKPENVLSPDYYQSAGRMFGSPAVSDTEIVWSGDLDQINAHLFGEHEADLNILVPDGVSNAPAMFYPQIYLGTRNGYLIAFDYDHLKEIWRFSTGSPILQRPIAIGPVVFTLPEDGGMYAVDPKSGNQQWFAADPVQFVAASPTRIYARDQFGRLIALDLKTGNRAAVMPLPRSLKALTNNHTDRLVLFTDEGLIQSLHERALPQPIIYLPPKPEAPKKGAGGGSKTETAPAGAAAAPAANAMPAAAANG